MASMKARGEFLVTKAEEFKGSISLVHGFLDKLPEDDSYKSPAERMKVPFDVFFSNCVSPHMC